jgi:hypothetical protein
LHDNKVYRVPVSITPDLVMMYLEGVNAERLAIQAGSRRITCSIREEINGLITVGEMMERLGFKPAFIVERVGTEV